MSAKRPWEAGTGAWVAFRDEPPPRRPGERRRAYTYHPASPLGSNDSTTIRDGAPRYDSKAEALADARTHWPRRAAGCRIGAERFSQTVT